MMWTVGALLNEFHICAVAACTSYGILVSFTLARVVDKTAYTRLAEKRKLSTLEFHLGNTVTHVLPVVCAASLALHERSFAWWHGASAALIHTLWWVWVSHGSLVLDDVYVPLSRSRWIFLCSVAVAVETAVPLLLCYLKPGCDTAAGMFSHSITRNLSAVARRQPVSNSTVYTQYFLLANFHDEHYALAQALPERRCPFNSESTEDCQHVRLCGFTTCAERGMSCHMHEGAAAGHVQNSTVSRATFKVVS